MDSHSEWSCERGNMQRRKRACSRPTSSKRDSTANLQDAILLGTLADVKRLTLSGATIDGSGSDGFTSLMLAATRGDARITAFLIRQGADVNRRNDIGQTALMIAAKGGHKKIIGQLIQAGADSDAVDNDRRNAIAWATTHEDLPDVVALLVALGANYNARDIRGLTPLMRAAMLGFARTVAVLLTAGADAKLKYRGKTASEMARERGHDEVCKTILAVLENRPKGDVL